MKFAEAIVTPYIRRRSWPNGDYAVLKVIDGRVWWERHIDNDHSSYYSKLLDVPGTDWERYTPDFLQNDGGADG